MYAQYGAVYAQYRAVYARRKGEYAPFQRNMLEKCFFLIMLQKADYAKRNASIMGLSLVQEEHLQTKSHSTQNETNWSIDRPTST